MTAALLAQPAIAQDAATTAQDGAQAEPGPDPDPVSDADTIVVLATRVFGQVDAPQPPLLELGAEEIAAYGSGSIAELLEAIAPQVSSARGRGGDGGPVILVNGVRISSFRELRSYPPEAIEKVEVFAEEVAQRYGYSADQRVVNFILKDNYQSREIELEYGQPWDGGYSTQEVEATYLRIDGPSRFNLNLDWNNSSRLTEAERDIIQTTGAPAAGAPDPADFRTLVSDTAAIEGTANWTTALGESGDSVSLNASVERDDSLRLQGLSALSTPLEVDRRSKSYSVGGTLNMGLGDWQLTGTFDGTHGETRSFIDVFGDPDSPLDPGYEEARSKTDRAETVATVRGSPFYLPAGDVSLTLAARYVWNRIQSTDTRNPGVETSLSRGRTAGSANVSVPLTSRRDDVLAAVGDISLNASLGVDYLSDFGTLTDWSAGLTWGVTDTLSFSASHIQRDTAPSLTQLGSPEIATFNVPIYDLSTGDTVLATVIDGGNPNLPSQSQRDWKFGVVWDLPFLERSNVSVDYIRNHSEDIAASFPVLTPEIEAAFPGRVTRDGNGMLLAVDQRPVTFAAQDVERLQFGLNLSGQIKGDEAEPAGGGGGGFGGRGGGPAAIAGDSPAPGGGGQRDPARFAEMRERMCGSEGETLAQRLIDAEAAGTLGSGEMAIPPQMLERFRGEDGKIDAARVNSFRERVCSGEAPGPDGRAGGPPGGAGPASAGGATAGGPPAGGGFRGGLGRFARGGGPGDPPGGGRWFFNLQYTLDLNNEVLIGENGPLLDLLDGDALTGGGNPRHSANARAGIFKDGFGLIASGNYYGASRLDGSGLPGSTDLRFGDYATVDLRTFFDFNSRENLVAKVPLLKGTRISFDIDNLFDSRQRVTDNTGIVPLRYQPFLVDPVGRSFEIEVRKLF